MVGVAVGPAPVRAQEPGSGGGAIVTATAGGQRYEAGAVWRFLFGSQYRDLWGTEVQVERLDLTTFAGGLEPTRTGGGLQTRSLRFDAGDGREYRFRSIDKTPVLDSLLQNTFISEIVQDEISAAHPYGALVAAPLMRAAGVLHATPRLVVLPDDPNLGPFRQEFAGLMGLLEEHPDENGTDGPAFADAALVISSERLVERLDESSNDRVDAEGYLRARLVDLFLGDWDRHRDQWRWASFESGEARSWLPIARDRDQAFYRYEGVTLRLLSLYRPRFVRFGETYPAIDRLHWQSRDIDAWFLAELDRSTFEAVGRSVREALTDAVIEDAVAHLPEAIHAMDGPRLARTLRARRDRLDGAWTTFYDLLAESVSARGTDAADVASVEWLDDGAVRVELAAADRPQAPYWSRTLDASETSELRIELNGGDDRVVLSGTGASSITVRILGGPGHDVVIRESGDARPRIYDHEGDDRLIGMPGVGIDRKPYDAWTWSPEHRVAPRESGDWTLPIFWSSVTPDLGVFVGGGVRLTEYGFRKRPFARQLDIRAGYSPARRKWRAEFEGIVRKQNAPWYGIAAARVSRLDVARYYGLGNDTPSMSADFHRVDLTSTHGALGAGWSGGPRFDGSVRVVVKRTSTRPNEDRFFGTLGDVYGSGAFWQGEVVAEAEVDPLAGSMSTPHRIRVTAGGRLVPAVADVTTPFGRLGGTGTFLLASSNDPTLAFAARVGADKVFGAFPWYEAAFIGGQRSLRGWRANRFAGDAALHGSAELRLGLLRPVVVVPARLGVYGFADVGRVYVDGASPRGWRSGVGGGLFLQPLGQPYLLQIGVGFSSESTTYSAALGLPY